MAERELIGGKGRLGDRPEAWDRHWREASAQREVVVEKVAAIFELRRFYHEVIRPGTGAPTLDRSVGGVRRRGD